MAYVLPTRSSEEELGGLTAYVDNEEENIPRRQPRRLKNVEFYLNK